jgi:hypothetical protein
MAALIQYRLTGGASNSNPNASLGGVMSTTVMNTVAINNLFDNVPSTDVDTGNNVEYRAFDIYNVGDVSTNTMQFFLTDTPSANSSVSVWLDTTGTQSIANETTEPVGATWSEPDTVSKMDLTDLASETAHRIWIRRTVIQSAPLLVDDTATLHTWYN